MTILACTPCRSRKVACDRQLPSCTRCLFSHKTCEYRARKSAKPAAQSRRKLFESRLESLETRFSQETTVAPGIEETDTLKKGCITDDGQTVDWSHSKVRKPSNSEWPETPFATRSRDERFLPEEPLQRKLYGRYFQYVYPTAPIIHPSRFFNALEGDPTHVPPLALRFAMWAMAALGSAEHQHLAEKLYNLGRKYAYDLEMQSEPKKLVLSHAQCWFLLGLYEATLAYHTQAFMSVGRCVRLVQMMSLHLLDDPNEENHVLKKSDWTETEERRRVFWGAYLGDRWASSLSGHPLMIRDTEISTNLPSSETSFRTEIEEIGISVRQAGGPDNITSLSPFAASVFTTTLLGRCLDHIFAYEHDDPSKGYGNYWISHQELDTSISHTFMNLPTQLRVSAKEQNVQVVLSQFNLHVAIILLHQTAIKAATNEKVHHFIRQNNFQRCLISAIEIKKIVYSVKDLKMLADNMWLAFSIYKAAGVFIEDMLKSDTSPTSAVDLGLLLIALKELNADQSYVCFFAKRIESEISRTGIACYIPTYIRHIVSVDISQGKLKTECNTTGVDY